NRDTIRSNRVPRASGDKPRHVFAFYWHHRVPRASGDKPGNWAIIWALFMCSPRQRG
ncbi:hypothetical protein SEES004_04963, partial [Salmonella enterica subsp. enterica serovar Senftenberg str. 361154004]